MTTQQEVYNGKYVIEFNPKAHRYKVLIRNPDGLLVPYDAIPDGVTTICGAIVPKHLDGWAAKMAADHIAAGYVKAQEDGERLELSAFLALCDEAKTAHIKKRDSAGDRGSDVHDYIESFLKGEAPERLADPIARKGVQAFEEWYGEFDGEILETERIIFSKELFYCGKTDVYGLYYGRPSILDFKTGSGFYDDMPYQLTGYAVALEEELGVKIEDGYIVHLDKRDATPYVYHVKLNDGMKDAWIFGVKHYKRLKQVRAIVKEIKNGMAKSR